VSPKEALVQPFLKWAGGKRQLMPAILPLIPAKVKRYFEPFVGGGAVFLSLQPAVAVINDLNCELINCYKVIRDSPEELLKVACKHQNTKDYYYYIREIDRSPEFEKLSSVERAARILYLNKTCYNGLFRVNSQGQFNVPFGAYKNPVIADPAVIRAVSDYLNQAQIDFVSEDFAKVVQAATKADLVYFDPPYDPVSETASFTGYYAQGFNREEQKRLKETCDDLTARGVRVLLSNSDTPYIRELYGDAGYRIQEVKARRNINSVGEGRGTVNELLILNYEPF
jgi:DNA adenine methylase